MAFTLELLNAANIQLLLYPPLTIAGQSGAQSIPTNAFTAITWTTPTVDTYTMWSVANPTRITPKVAGTYTVVATVGLAVNGTGGRAVEICKNGVGTIVAQVSHSNAGAAFNTVIQVTASVACNGTTDYFEVYVDQASGGALNTVIAVTSVTAQLTHLA